MSYHNKTSLGGAVTYDQNGKQLCLCADGTAYENCGNRCQCCSKVSRQAPRTIAKKTWSTISCPCSSYAITNAHGGVECEMDLVGSKRRLKAVVFKNHTINSAQPRVRDKWDCSNDSKIPCGEGDLKWETLHVVSVSVGNTTTVAKVNSKSSNSNCHIPPTTLVEYDSTITENGNSVSAILYNNEMDPTQTGRIDYSDIDGVDITNPVSSFNDVLLFKTEEQAGWWDYFNGTGKKFVASEYLNEDGVTMYFPGVYYPNHKLITKAHINKYDILSENLKANWDYDKNSSSSNNFIVSTGGEVIKIKLVGKNNPVVDITIKNSSGRSILKRKLEGVIINNEFVLQQQIPGISNSREVETYYIEIKPSADTHYYPEQSPDTGSNLISAGIMKFTIWQHRVSKITISSTASTIANTTTTGSAVSISGPINSKTFVEKSLVQTVKVSRSSGSHLFYINQEKKRNIQSLESDQIIKMKIKGNEDGQEMKCYDQFTLMETEVGHDHFYSRKDADGVEITTGKIEVGMRFEGTFTKTATIKKSIDLDASLHELCPEDEVVEIFTNKFEVGDTSKLFEGMLVKGVRQSGHEFVSLLTSVDCEKSITLSDHFSIKNDTLLTFTFSDGGTVAAIDKDNSRITGVQCLSLPENTIIEFRKPSHPVISGNISFDKSGGIATTITNTVNSATFGEGEHILSFDVDSYVTTKPNAQDQRLETFSDQNLIINFVKLDTDYNKTSKTITIVTQPAKGTTSAVRSVGGDALPQLLRYTPVRGFIGNDKIKFTVADANSQVSDEKTIFITIE